MKEPASLSLDDAWAFALTAESLSDAGRRREPSGSALLLRSRDATGDHWWLMSPTGRGVRINGVPVIAGFRVLEDGDEIRIDGIGRMVFVDEGSY